MVKYGISHTDFFDSVWYVTTAINSCKEFDISYPSSPEEQYKIAEVFKSKSGVSFDKCAGAIDGILIWIDKPL